MMYITTHSILVNVDSHCTNESIFWAWFCTLYVQTSEEDKWRCLPLRVGVRNSSSSSYISPGKALYTGKMSVVMWRSISEISETTDTHKEYWYYGKYFVRLTFCTFMWLQKYFSYENRLTRKISQIMILLDSMDIPTASVTVSIENISTWKGGRGALHFWWKYPFQSFVVGV